MEAEGGQEGGLGEMSRTCVFPSDSVPSQPDALFELVCATGKSGATGGEFRKRACGISETSQRKLKRKVSLWFMRV
jgi:hypothetical protein